MSSDIKKRKETSKKSSKSNKSKSTTSTNALRQRQQPHIHKTEYNFSLWNIWVATTLLKILLFPAYHSTDFDVHRNWLSITKLLPLKQWYIEDTNQWTLDYPPFFAYFEWFLSQLVPEVVAKDGCIDITPKGDYGQLTIIFQRVTVLVSEIVLFLSLQWFIDTSKNLKEKKRNFVIASSIALSPGLIIVDHIHFQYNGILFGVLILSIVNAKLGNHLMCGFWFAVLLCFKHIFLYVAPCYFVFLLSGYCLKPSNTLENNKKTLLNLVRLVNWLNLIKLGSVVIFIFVAAFAPFAYYNVLPQLFSRLFPFSRGLTHAYWAPNMWAIYSFIDRVLLQMSLKLPGFQKFLEIITKKEIHIALENSKAMTKGVVGEVEFSILPTVQPSHTFMLTLFYQVMSLIPLFIQPTYERFVGSLSLCAWASFLFGWHVHEKAIMLVIIPLSFIATQDRKLLPIFQALSTSGYVSLFPLLYESPEWLFKILITFVWCVIYHNSFNEVCLSSKVIYSRKTYILDRLNLIYVFTFIPICILVQLLDVESRNFEILRKLEFIRLMIYSVYCAIGVISSWNWFSWLYFLDDTIWDPKD